MQYTHLQTGPVPTYGYLALFFVFWFALFTYLGLYATSDFPDHASIAYQFFQQPNWPDGVRMGYGFLAYPIYLISPTVQAITITFAFFCAIATTIKLLIYRKILSANVPSYFLYAVGLCFAYALALNYLFHGAFTLSTFSPNSFHNTTFLISAPIAISIFIRLIRLYGGGNGRYTFVVLALLIIALLSIKPNFMFSACGLMGLLSIQTIREKRYAVAVQYILLAFITLGILYIQKLGLFDAQEVGGDKMGVIIAPFAVAKLYISSVPAYLIFSLAFPISILIVKWRYKLAFNLYLSAAWLLLVLDTLIFILFAEEGPRFSHMNFSWGRGYSTALVFVFSIDFMFAHIKHPTALLVCKTLFWGHVLSGIIFIVYYISTKVYF